MPVRPLLARPGARFACAGDGLCCTDAHVLGPLVRSEVSALHAAHPGSTVHNAQIHARALRVVGGGGCLFRGDDGCAIHVARGGVQPRSCQRYPHRLIATPAGGRVVTDHRCPCRTLGDRPRLDLAQADRVLRDGAGRLQVDARVGAEIALEAGKVVAFAEYLPIERAMLERLARGDDALDVLDAPPFPRLDTLTWTDVAHHYRSRLDGTACGDALAWFGDMVMTLQGTQLRALRARPWQPAFDRAERRTARVESADTIVGDWLSDAIWGLEWVERGSFRVARGELATRVVVAREIVRRLVGEGGRSDRAAAEAVMIVELAGATALYRGVVDRIATGVPSSPRA